VRRSKEFQPHAVLAFVHTVATSHMPRKAVQWLEALQEGEHRTRAHPVWHLRRKLGGRQALTKPLWPLEVAALAAKTWNAFAANEEVTGLTWTESGPKAEAFLPSGERRGIRVPKVTPGDQPGGTRPGGRR
jgi:hypothetical protein